MPDSESQIRLRAYSIWEAENRPEGKHLKHWFRAEAEIEGEAAANPKLDGPSSESSLLEASSTDEGKPELSTRV